MDKTIDSLNDLIEKMGKFNPKTVQQFREQAIVELKQLKQMMSKQISVFQGHQNKDQELEKLRLIKQKHNEKLRQYKKQIDDRCD